MKQPLPEGRLGLFGGTFDPVHAGHLNLARYLLTHHLLEAVVFMPAGQPPHKRETPITADRHRLAMLELATDDEPGMFVSDFELQREGPSYTVDTAEHFANRHGANLRLILGMDSLLDLHRWYRSEDLVAGFEFLIYPRPGYPPPDEAWLREHFGEIGGKKMAVAMINAPMTDISSREIREAVRRGNDISSLLPTAVQDYIQTYGLYCK